MEKHELAAAAANTLRTIRRKLRTALPSTISVSEEAAAELSLACDHLERAAQALEALS